MTDMAAISWSRGSRGRARADRPSRPGRHAGSRGREAVTIISAPAGSGKTSLLHAWAGRARTTGSPSCPYGRASATRSCSSSRCGRGPRRDRRRRIPARGARVQRAARHATPARQCRPQRRGPVLLVHEARQGAIEQLLSLVAQHLPPDKFSFCLDEPHVFRIGPLDGRPSASRVPLEKHLVQVAVKQLLRVRHAIESPRPEGLRDLSVLPGEQASLDSGD